MAVDAKSIPYGFCFEVLSLKYYVNASPMNGPHKGQLVSCDLRNLNYCESHSLQRKLFWEHSEY